MYVIAYSECGAAQKSSMYDFDFLVYNETSDKFLLLTSVNRKYIFAFILNAFSLLLTVYYLIYRNLVNFRATKFNILIFCCGYFSLSSFTHEILSPRK